MGRSINPVVWDQWRERLRRFEASRLTVAAWCRAEGISQARFYQWRKKLSRELEAVLCLKQRTATRPAFVSVVPTSLASTVVLTLANGVRVELPAHDHVLVTDVVQVAAVTPSAGGNS